MYFFLYLISDKKCCAGVRQGGCAEGECAQDRQSIGQMATSANVYGGVIPELEYNRKELYHQKGL